MNLDTLAAGFFLASAEARKDAEGALVKAAEATVDTAKSLAPSESGFMAGTIDWTRADSSGVIGANIGSDAYYDLFVEYGTVRQAPQPFYGPALDMTSDYFVSEMESIGARIL